MIFEQFALSGNAKRLSTANIIGCTLHVFFQTREPILQTNYVFKVIGYAVLQWEHKCNFYILIGGANTVVIVIFVTYITMCSANYWGELPPLATPGLRVWVGVAESACAVCSVQCARDTTRRTLVHNMTMLASGSAIYAVPSRLLVSDVEASALLAPNYCIIYVQERIEK